MRIGLIARSDLSRGLGSQTYDLYRHLSPTKTLIVDVGDRTPYKQTHDVYSGNVLTTTWRPDGSIDLPHLRWFLSDIDIVLSAETFYDPRVITLAEERGIPTVLQANYEFCYHIARPDLPRPTLFAFPSTWQDSHWPPNSTHLPFPVDRSIHQFRPRTHARHLLHVAGHPTRADRDGTNIVLETIPYIRRDIELTITSQQPHFPRAMTGHFTLNIHRGDLPSLVPHYQTADLLLLPRRFGGQSLKLNEAVANGVFPVMVDCEPQSRFLPRACLVKGIRDNHFLRTQAGNVPQYRVRPSSLATYLHTLIDNPSVISNTMAELEKWVDSISWSTLYPTYISTFEKVIKG